MCLTPLIINSLTVPCGNCIECVQASRSEWMYRNLVEQSHYKNSYFVTLTYDEDNLATLDFNSEVGLAYERKEDRINFFKALRNRYGKESIRYYGCFEYGDKTYRPHYHFIVYTNDDIATEVFGSVWCYGQVHVEKSRQAAIHYVSGYLQKPMRRYNHKEEYLRVICRNDMDALFDALFNLHLYRNTKKYMSTHPAIGSSLLEDKQLCEWIRSYTFEHLNYPRLGFFGREYKLPRFYIKKLFTDEERRLIYENGIKMKDDNERKIIKERGIDYRRLRSDLRYINKRKIDNLLNDRTL